MKDFISAKNETRIERGRKGDASKATPAAKHGRARHGKTPSSPASRVWRLAALVLCAGVIGGGAWWWMARSERAPQEERVVKKAAPTVRRPRVRQIAAPKKEPAPPAETNILDWTRTELARVRARMRNASPESLENLKRKEADLEKLLVDEKYQFHMTNVPKVAYQPFKTCTEQVMDWIFNCNVGDDPPPFVPPMDQSEMENISDILDRANELLDEDTPETAERKRIVDAAKKELKEYMAQGGSPSAFLHYYHQQLVTAYEMRLEASRIVREFARDATQEDARKFLERTNAELAKKGIAPVQLSDKMKMKLGIPIEEETK